MSTVLNKQVSSLAGPVPGRHRVAPGRDPLVPRRGPARDPRRPAGLVTAPRHARPVRCAPRTAASSLGWLVLAAGVALLLVLSIGWLGSDDGSAQPVPQTTALVQVRSGDTLTAIARRMDPASSTVAVADRIRTLNELTDAPLLPGQLLRVPVGPGVKGALTR